MKKDNFETMIYELGFSIGTNPFRVEYLGEVSDLIVDVSLNYNYIEGNEIVINDGRTTNLQNIDDFTRLLADDAAIFKQKYEELKKVLSKK